jgi:septal ring factor EnvC (AmiA/AmiB activator)
MKLTRLPVIALLSLLSFASVSYAQTEGTSENTSGKSTNTLNKQFLELKEKANNYQDYKVIKHYQLNDFWKGVIDSVTAYKKDIVVAQKEIDTQKAELSQLKTELKATQQEVHKNDYASARISVLGIQMLKENYIYLNFGIIGVLLVMLAIAFFSYHKSKRIAHEKVTEFDAVQSELNSYKQRLRERETIMGRELQTERNKVDELMQKLAKNKTTNTALK